MDSVRDEVRRKLAGFERDWMGGDNLSILFCGEIESHLELEQDPDSDTGWHEDVETECDATFDALTDAIMSVFKRGSGVVDAEDIARAIHKARYAGASWAVDFDMLDGCEDAQYLDALRRDAEAAAKRITSAVDPKNSADNLDSAPSIQNGLDSAVEPSGVVTDAFDPDAYNPGVSNAITDAVAELWARNFGLNHEDEEYDPEAPAWAQFCETQVDRGYGVHGQYWELSAIVSWTASALTAALSPRTEEEVRAEVIEELDKGSAELKKRAIHEYAANGAASARKLARQSDALMVAVDWLRARSLTNGGG